MAKFPAPKDITFLQTFKCSTSCKNCCFGCRQTRGSSLSAEEMIRYLDLGRKVFGPFTGIQFSGGECMLNYDDVLKTMKYAYENIIFGERFYQIAFGQHHERRLAIS